MQVAAADLVQHARDTPQTEAARRAAQEAEDRAAVERERAIFTEQALESGKPAGVVEKMVEGRIRKFFEEVVLLKQAFVMNPDLTVEQLVAETAKTLGTPVVIKGFARLALGEGIEKKTDDLAEEVAKLM